jgi:hypothetical protein
MYLNIGGGSGDVLGASVVLSGLLCTDNRASEWAVGCVATAVRRFTGTGSPLSNAG